MATTSPAEPMGVLDPDFAPADVHMIDSLEGLRAISDPTRLRILETMGQRRTPAWSVKELAAELGLPQTRLYHHVDQLVANGLIRAVERRVVSGIIETRYCVVARSFQLARGLLAGDGEEQRIAMRHTLAAVFDTARDEVEQSIRTGAIDPGEDDSGARRVLLSRGMARLSPSRVAEFRERLQALEKEFGVDDDADAAAYGVVLAVYPMPRLDGERPAEEPRS